MLASLIPILLPKKRPTLESAVRALFALGEQGCFIDYGDLSTLFQDTAKNVPVTAVGQTVRYAVDKSGRGNHNIAPGTGALGILRLDSTGRYYLETNGTDHYGRLPVMTIAQPCVSAFGLAASVTASRQNNLFRSPSALAVFYLNNGPFAMFSGNTAIQRSTATTLNLPYVTTQIWLQPTSRLRVNAVDAASGSPGTNGIANAESIYTGCGVASNAAASFFAGRIYTMILRAGSVTQAQIDQIEAFVNSRTGGY